MSYGIQINRASGANQFDVSTTGACVIDVVAVNAGSTENRSYTSYAGRTVFVMPYSRNVNGWVGWPTISYGSGYPYVSCPNISLDYSVIVVVE